MPGESAAWIAYLRPQWILLMLFFWAQQLPNRNSFFSVLLFGLAGETTYRRGIIIIWCFGFFADVVLNEPFGLNGAIFSSVAFFVWRFHQRHQMQSRLQQSMMVFLIVFVAEVFRAMVMYFAGDRSWDILPLTISISSAVLWPFLGYFMLRLIGPGRT
jgi:rod shape-determining protein MreD